MWSEVHTILQFTRAPFLEKSLVEFTAELRHYCRNPKCRSKLKSPVSNPRGFHPWPGPKRRLNAGLFKREHPELIRSFRAND